MSWSKIYEMITKESKYYIPAFIQ